MMKILEVTYAWYDSYNKEERMIEVSKSRLYLPIETPLEYDLTIYQPYCLKGKPFFVPRGSAVKCEVLNNIATLTYNGNIFVFNGDIPEELGPNPTIEERNARYEEYPDDYYITYGPYLDMNDGEFSNIHLCQIIETEKSFDYFIQEEKRNRFLSYKEYESIYFRTYYDKTYEDPDKYFDECDDEVLYDKVRIALIAEFPQYFSSSGDIDISTINNEEELDLLVRREYELLEEFRERLLNISNG